MSFHGLLTDADPAEAARAAIIMAESTMEAATAPASARLMAEQVLELGEAELTERIRASRRKSAAEPGRASAARRPALPLGDKILVQVEAAVTSTGSASQIGA